MSDKQHDERDQPARFKPGQTVRVEGVVEWAGELRPGSCGVVVMDLSTPIARRTVVVDASAVHLAPGDGDGEGEQLRQLTKPYTEHLRESLQDPREAAAYLRAALEDGDPEVIELAASDVAKILDCFPSGAGAPEGGDDLFNVGTCDYHHNGTYYDTNGIHLKRMNCVNWQPSPAPGRDAGSDVRCAIDFIRNSHQAEIPMVSAWADAVEAQAARCAELEDKAVKSMLRGMVLDAIAEGDLENCPVGGDECAQRAVARVEAQARRLALLEQERTQILDAMFGTGRKDAGTAQGCVTYGALGHYASSLIRKGGETEEAEAKVAEIEEREAKQARRLEAAMGIVQRLAVLHEANLPQGQDALLDGYIAIAAAAAAFLAGDAEGDGNEQRD